MRVLGVGHHGDLGDLYLRLVARGHEVKVFIDDVDSADVLEGMIARSKNWRDDLAWIRADADGLVLFEGVGWGEAQDALRREGLRVMGGSALGDRLEHDRTFGQSVLREAGMKTAATHEFEGFDAALDFVRTTQRRWVLKYCGEGYASTRNYVGQLDDGRDMLAVLEQHRRRWTYEDVPRLLLMEHLEGVHGRSTEARDDRGGHRVQPQTLRLVRATVRGGERRALLPR